jgi:hypothetical protein
MGHEDLVGQRSGLGGGFRRPAWQRELWKVFAETKDSIIQSIEVVTAATAYSTWRIGLTHDPIARHQQWKETQLCTAWRQWIALSLRDAQDIESRFIHRGMKGGTGGNLDAGKMVYVYIF